MAQIVRQGKNPNIVIMGSSIPLSKRLQLGATFTPGLMELSGLEDLVELGAEFSGVCMCPGGLVSGGGGPYSMSTGLCLL